MNQSQSPSSSPAELLAGNDDLLIEILSYLPVKPLLRFKSVNKQFLSLISDPQFSLLHSLRHSHLPSSALFLRRHHHPSLSSFDFIPISPNPQTLTLTLTHPIDILQSCNGLLLCANNHIYNPTTNQTVSVPLPSVRPILGLNMAFDVSRSAHYYLICIWKLEQNSFAIDAYSSGNRQWRPAVGHFTAPFDVEFERGVYCHGRVYWLSHTESTVYFDLDSEAVETLKLPKPLEGAYIERFRYFGESCGHLHLIEIRTNCVPIFDVLELNRESMEWFVKFRVDLDVLGRGFEAEMFQDSSDRFNRRFRFYAFSILALVRGKEHGDGDDVLVVSVPGKVIAYSFESRVSRLVSNVGDDSDKWLPFKGYNAYQFIESLYCL